MWLTVVFEICKWLRQLFLQWYTWVTEATQQRYHFGKCDPYFMGEFFAAATVNLKAK